MPVIVVGFVRPGAGEQTAAEVLKEIQATVGERMPAFRLIEFAHEDADRALAQLPLDIPDAVIALVDAERWLFAGVKSTGPQVQMPDGSTIHVSDKDGVSLPHVERLCAKICEAAPTTRQRWLLVSRGFGFGRDVPATLSGLGNLDIMQLSDDRNSPDLTEEFRTMLAKVPAEGTESAFQWVTAKLPAGKIAEIAKANVLALADQPIEAYRVIAAVAEAILADKRPEEILQLAQMAVAAGQLPEGRKWLGHLPDAAALDFEHLRATCLIASQVDAPELEQACRENLKQRFPRDPTVLLRAFNELLNQGKFGDAAKQAEETGHPFRREVARFLGGEATLENVLTVATEAGELPEAYWVLAKEAKRRKDYPVCRRYAFLLADDAQRKGEAMSLFARALGSEMPGVDENDFREEIDRLLRFCAKNPAELEPRFALEALFENNSSARDCIAHTAALLARELERLSKAYDPATIPAKCQLEMEARSRPEAFATFVRRLLVANAGRPWVVGAGQLSAEEIAEITPSLWADMLHALMQTKADAMQAPLYLHAILLMSAATNDAASDVVAVREVSSHLALSKDAQKALDLAESMMILLPARKVGHRMARLSAAWLNYADVTLRMHNVLAGLRHVYFACVTLEEAPTHRRSFLDIFRVAARTARELRIAPLAFRFIELEASLLPALPEGMLRARQLDQLTLSILLQLWRPADGAEAILSVAEAALDQLDQDGAKDEIAPLISVAAQAAQFHRVMSGGTPAKLQRRLEKHAKRLPPERRELIRSLLEKEITTSGLRRLASGVVRASGDWSHALAPALVAARNALGAACDSGDPELFWTACLIICQPGLAVRSSETLVGPAEGDPVAATKWMAHQIEAGRSVADAVMVQRAMSNASEEGVGKKLFEVSLNDFLGLIGPDETVVLLATDNAHALYRCGLRRGAAAKPVKVDATEWDYTRFREWSADYPRKYGTDVEIYYGHLRQPPPDNVSASLSGLLPAGKPGTATAVVVAEGRLFSFAHRLAGEIAGQKTALAVAPSARWLAGVRSSPLATTGAAAWLASAPAGDRAMEALHAELPTVFAQSGIARIESATLPILSAKELVVIGCHGRGTNQEGFARLVDDDTAYEPDDVARRLADTAVVVLFVCHGGRGDESLYSHETSGLTSSLLRHGVRAIVAALWPLDASLAAPWLEEFAKTDPGTSVAERVDQAQRSLAAREPLAQRYGEHPLVKATFTVFGDGSSRIKWSR